MKSGHGTVGLKTGLPSNARCKDSRIQKRRLGGLRLTCSSLAHLHSKHESSLASLVHMFTVTIRYCARLIAALWAGKAAMDTSRL
jgi:hypothetical protein